MNGADGRAGEQKLTQGQQAIDVSRCPQELQNLGKDPRRFVTIIYTRGKAQSVGAGRACMTTSVTLSAAQAQGLIEGFSVLAQRIGDLSDHAKLTTEMVALAQPMATMQNIAQTLQDGLGQPFEAVVVNTSKTVAEIKTLIETAVDTAGAINITRITDSR